MRRILLAILIVLMLAGQAWGATRYVGGAGASDEAGCGTAILPCATYNYMLTGSRTTIGDTVILAAGTYEEVQTQPALAAGSGTTTIQPADGATVNINIKTGLANGAFFWIASSFKFTGINFTNTNNQAKPWFLIYNNSATPQNSYFENCTFTGGTTNIANMIQWYGDNTGRVHNAYLSKNTFTITTANPMTGSLTAQVNAYFDSNLIKAPYLFVTGTNSVAAVTARNNTFIFPASGTAYGFSLQVAGNTLVAYNNVIVSQADAQCFWTASDAVVAEWVAGPAKGDVDYNIFWTTQASFDVVAIQSLVYDTSTSFYPVAKNNRLINVDMTNFAGGDYTLKSTSYAAGRGAATNHPTDGLDRSGSTLGANDVGCYVNPTKLDDPAVTANKVIFLGDSIMNGSSATAGNKCYEVFAGLVTSATVASGGSVALGGMKTRSAIIFVDYAFLANTPATVIVSVGNNDVGSPKSIQTNAQVATDIITLLQKIEDYGARPIWLGIPSITGNPPDNTDVTAVNDLVEAACVTNGWSYASILKTMTGMNSAWKTDYYADLTTDVHPDNDGHLVIGTIAANLYSNKYFTVIDANDTTVSYKVCDGYPAVPCVGVYPSVTGAAIYNLTIKGLTKGINHQSDVTIKNVLFEACTTDINDDGGTSTVSNNYASTDGDPLFVSATDLRLQPSSPAINAGTDLCSTLGTATDFRGRSVCIGGALNKAVTGPAPDIGAYEGWKQCRPVKVGGKYRIMCGWLP